MIYYYSKLKCYGIKLAMYLKIRYGLFLEIFRESLKQRIARIISAGAHRKASRRRTEEATNLWHGYTSGYSMGVARIFSGEHFLGFGLVGSPGGLRPPDAEEISKIFKKILRKIAKMHYFSIFFKRFALIFRAFVRKSQFVGNFEKILKMFDENSIEKLKF